MKPLFDWNYWYSARANEIFLDLDSNRAVARALSVLRLAVRKKDLDVKSVWLFQTQTAGHAHMIILLSEARQFVTRIAWSLWLGNDRLRVAYILERRRFQWEHEDLLVSRYPYLFRKHDALCLCPGKHKDPSVTDKCQAMTFFLGDQRSADYFTRTGKAPPRRKIRIPWGKVSLKQIKNWSPVYEHERARLLPDIGTIGGIQGVEQEGIQERSSTPDISTDMAGAIHAGDSPTTERNLRASGKDRQES